MISEPGRAGGPSGARRPRFGHRNSDRFTAVSPPEGVLGVATGRAGTSISPGSAAARPRGRTAPTADRHAGVGDWHAGRRHAVVAGGRDRPAVGRLDGLCPCRARGVDGRRARRLVRGDGAVPPATATPDPAHRDGCRAQGAVRTDARNVLSGELSWRRDRRADPRLGRGRRASTWLADRQRSDAHPLRVARRGALVERG